MKFFEATQVIFESKKICNVISNDTFNTLNNSYDRIKQICNDNFNQNIINNNNRSYVTPRLNNLSNLPRQHNDVLKMYILNVPY